MGSDPVERLSAVTLVCTSMAASVDFYEALGFTLLYGGTAETFSSFRVGGGYLNLQTDPDRKEPLRKEPPPGAAPGAAPERPGGSGPQPVWGRVIFWVDDVDAMHARAVAAGRLPLAAPADAPWGERYFHIRDPDGHEISFARPL